MTFRDDKGRFCKKPVVLLLPAPAPKPVVLKLNDALKGKLVQNLFTGWKTELTAEDVKIIFDLRQSVVEEARKRTDGFAYIGTCSYAVVSKIEPRFHIHDACHARSYRNGDKKTQAVIEYFNCVDKNVREFVQWYITVGPFASIILTKDVDDVLQNGMLIDPTAPRWLVSTCQASTRICSEHRNYLASGLNLFRKYMYTDPGIFFYMLIHYQARTLRQIGHSPYVLPRLEASAVGLWHNRVYAPNMEPFYKQGGSYKMYPAYQPFSDGWSTDKGLETGTLVSALYPLSPLFKMEKRTFGVINKAVNTEDAVQATFDLIKEIRDAYCPA